MQSIAVRTVSLNFWWRKRESRSSAAIMTLPCSGRSAAGSRRQGIMRNGRITNGWRKESVRIISGL